jgi:O-antigen ligase
MKVFFSFIALVKKQPLVFLLFIALFFSLFLGDGKQPLVDVVMACSTLVLVIVSYFYLPEKRNIQIKTLMLWLVFVLYLAVRTIFSDDVGFSIYSTIRYIEGFLFYYIFYCYSTEDTPKIFTHILLWFCVFALCLAGVTTFFPKMFVSLPLMNLLYPNYGHNHVVDILLFGFPVALLYWIHTKKTFYALFVVFFIAGTVFSFARAALIMEAVFINCVVFYFFVKKQKIKKAFVVVSLVVTSFVLVFLCIPYDRIHVNGAIYPKYAKQNNFDNTRFEYWRQASVAIRERPFFGSGPGTFYLQSKRLQKQPEAYSWFAHNVVLEQLVEIGIVGTLLLFFCIYSALRQGFQIPLFKNQIHACLVSALLLVFAVSAVDYALNYIVVWIIFWVTLAFISKPSVHDIYHFRAYKTVVLWFFTCILCCFYGFSMFQLVYSFSSVDMFIERKAVAILEKMSTPQLIPFILAVHKNNPKILFAAGLYKRAMLLDPQNTQYLHTYLLTPFQQNSGDQSEKTLFDITEVLFPNEKQIIATLLQKPPDIEQIYTKEFIESMSIQSTVGEYISKLYYALGLEIINDDPDSALLLWTIARDISPGWGHFHVELASIEYYLFKNLQKAEDILKQCQNYYYPAQQCKNAQNNIQYPGSLKKEIQNIPLIKL